LQTDDKKGGPINPVNAFETAFIATYPDKSAHEHPLYKYVKNVSKFEGFELEDSSGQTKDQLDIDQLFKPKRELMTCDEVFVLFLAAMCRKSNK